MIYTMNTKVWYNIRKHLWPYDATSLAYTSKYLYTLRDGKMLEWTSVDKYQEVASIFSRYRNKKGRGLIVIGNFPHNKLKQIVVGPAERIGEFFNYPQIYLNGYGGAFFYRNMEQEFVDMQKSRENLPNGLIIETKEVRAIYGDKGLISIMFKEGTTRVINNAFFSCYTLKWLRFSSTMQQIGSRAFFECNIEVLHIPSSVKCIGDFAFNGCSLTTVSMGEKVNVGLLAFACNPLLQLHQVRIATTSDFFVEKKKKKQKQKQYYVKLIKKSYVKYIFKCQNRNDNRTYDTDMQHYQR